MYATRAEHHHRAELRVIHHAEQHLDTAPGNHRRDDYARPETSCKIPVCAEQRGFVAQVEPDAVEFGLVIRAARRGLQHHRIPELAGRQARIRFGVDHAAVIRRQLQVAQ